jgi:hypothetical protein
MASVSTTSTSSETNPISGSRFIVLVGITAVLFFLSLVPTEVIPEIPVDIDFKPYFIPLTLVALLPIGRPTVAIALGVALGEGLRDLMEGYEIDDPIGFFGYLFGFVAAGYAMGARPLNPLMIAFGSIVCAAVQGFIEASAFLIFGEQSFPVALITAIGNTITHGVIMGAIPAISLVRSLHGRFERFLGFAPKGAPQPRQRLRDLVQQERAQGVSRAESEKSERALVDVSGLGFRYPGCEQPALLGVDLTIREGEVLALLGPSGAGKTTLCYCLAGVAPRDTGGEIIGTIAVDGHDPQVESSVTVASYMSIVTENAAAQLTQMRPVDEVAAALMNRGTPVTTRAQRPQRCSTVSVFRLDYANAVSGNCRRASNGWSSWLPLLVWNTGSLSSTKQLRGLTAPAANACGRSWRSCGNPAPCCWLIAILTASSNGRTASPSSIVAESYVKAPLRMS